MSALAPWLRHYDPGVRSTLGPYPNRTLLDYLETHARERTDGPAILYKGSTLSWRDLDQQSDAFAAALLSIGVQAGDRVGLLLPNCPQFLVAEFGAWKIGAIVAPLNPIYTEHELEGPLRENGVDTVVTLTRFYERVKRVQPKAGVKRVIATNIKHYFPFGLRLLFTLFREKKDGDRIHLAAGDYDYGQLMRAHAGQAPPALKLTADDNAVLLLSGGTTGTPKGVLGKHGAYTITGYQVQEWTKTVLGIADSRIMLPLPLFHVYGHVGVQGLAIVTANPLILVPNPRDLNDLLTSINKTKPTFFNGVPTLYVGMLNHPLVQQGKVDFKSIKICFCGAAALMAETRTRFEQLTGGRIVEGYSLTEAMMALVINPVDGPNKIGSVGMPLPDVMVRIYDADEGVRIMPPKEVGEICFAGNQIMVRDLPNGQISVSRFDPDRPEQRREVPPQVDAVVRAVVDLGGTYPDVVQLLQEAREGGALPSRLAINALPDTGRTYQRPDADAAVATDEEESAPEPSFRVASPLPSLFAAPKSGNKSAKDDFDFAGDSAQ